MEYGIWSLNIIRGLWVNRLVITPCNIFRESSPSLPLQSFWEFPQIMNHDEAYRQAIQLLTAKSWPSITSSDNYYETMTSTSLDTMKKEETEEANNENDMEIFHHGKKNNQKNYAENDEINDDGNRVDSQLHVQDDHDDTSCTESTNSSNPSGNVHLLLNKSFAPLSYFGLTNKDETTVTPIINRWVLGAYAAMLSAAAVNTVFEGTSNQVVLPQDHWQSDSESESDDSSSCTEKSTTSSSHVHRDSSSPCNIKCSTENIKKNNIINYDLTCIGTSNNNAKINEYQDELETHIASKHMTPGTSSSWEGTKKKTLSHQRVRYEREEYKCSLCSYTCTIEKAFQRHSRAHAKGGTSIPKTRVSCAVCGADRSSEVDLSRHMRRHRDDRYFCCDICVFRTVQLKKLIQHRRMHTGEKPHLCPHCAYRSARRDNLRSHVRRVHKKENLYCDTFSPRGILLCSTTNTITTTTPTNTTQVSSIKNSPSPIATVAVASLLSSPTEN